MAAITGLADIAIENGTASGPFRAPFNSAHDQEGSIHDDDTAQILSFRGGTIAGSIHREQVPPFLALSSSPKTEIVWFESTLFASCKTRRCRDHGHDDPVEEGLIPALGDGTTIKRGTHP